MIQQGKQQEHHENIIWEKHEENLLGSSSYL